MRRRQLLASACVATASLVGVSTASVASSRRISTLPGVGWRRTYEDLKIAATAPAHGGGQVLVGRGRGRFDPEVPVRVAVVDETGAVRQRREIPLNVPEDARRADADVIRTEDGYAVAIGSWFARLDADLSVEATGFASGYEPNSTTRIAELWDGFAVAAELNAPNHVSGSVFGFGDDGEFRWTRKYGEENSKWLNFLLDGPDGGVVVGGQAGDPWLADLAADGTQRWQTTVTAVPSGVGFDATRDGNGFTLFGESNAVRLTSSLSVEWQRTYDSFADASDGEIARTADGGSIIAAQVALDRVRVGKADAKGRLQWSGEYAVVGDGAAYLNDIVERAPGEYLVVGSRRGVQQGWALLLSEAETPTTRTTTPERTATSTGPKTTFEETTTSVAPSTAEKQTNTSIPGFGVGAALLGTAAGLAARRRR